jgi:hypothetical protein
MTSSDISLLIAGLFAYVKYVDSSEKETSDRLMAELNLMQRQLKFQEKHPDFFHKEPE